MRGLLALGWVIRYRRYTPSVLVFRVNGTFKLDRSGLVESTHEYWC